MKRYKVINGTTNEKKLIDNIINYLIENYTETSIDKLYEIEIVDSLSNDSSGRSIEHKMFLSRRYGLDGVTFQTDIKNNIKIDSNLKMLIGTIYHELWHINTWDKYKEMYDYVISEDNDIYVSFSYMYWIEYMAHVETIFLEDYQAMKKFCDDFSLKRWEDMEYGYSYFIKALPYYLVRSSYIDEYESSVNQISSEELRVAAKNFNRVSKELLGNVNVTEIRKARVIEQMIRKLFE